LKFKRELNLIDVFCIATGAMISSGLFILPGLAHAQAGPAVVFSYFFAGLLALTGMLSQAELVSAMPKTGGDYFYVTRSMGPAAGTIDGLIIWFSLSLKTAFALVGMAAFTKILVVMDIHAIAVILCFIFVLVNIIGVKEVAKLQRLLVFGLLCILTFYVVMGLGSVKVSNFDPFFTKGIPAVFATAGFVFVSFGGLLKVTSVAEEVKNPDKIIPLGMILSLFVVTIFYSLVVFVTSGVLGAGQLDYSMTPISDAAGVFLGDKGVLLLSIAAILAFVSTANAGILAAARYPAALAHDGLLPDFFGVVHKRYKTPYIAIIITGACIGLALFFDLTILVKMASTVLICTFMFSCLAIIIMHESKVQNYQPKFRSPFYPWVQILGIIGCGLLIFEMGKQSIIAFFVFIITGLFIHWFYGRIKVTKEYALLHLIERITAKELTTHSLETELKEIIRERDDIIKDRFDSIIEKSLVLDIDQPMERDDFFKLISKTLSRRLKIPQNILYELVVAREDETSTVIAPGIAIPHIVIEGEKLFDILLVRCKKGIKFSESTKRIQAVFVLVGSRGERNFHLRALAAIAQILQSLNFMKKWLSAKNEKVLKDIILLAKRVR